MSMDLLTSRTDVVLSSLNSQDLAYDGKQLYYLDSYNRISMLDLATGEEKHLDQAVASSFVLYPDGIEFHNRRDQNARYRIYLDGSIEKMN